LVYEKKMLFFNKLAGLNEEMKNIININKNKFTSISFLILSTITVFLLFLNSVFYPTLTLKYLKVDSLAILLGYFVITLLLLLKNEHLIPKKISEINNKILFPLLLAINTIFIFLEETQYPNFILRYFHIFPFSFVYILVLSGIIFYISKFRSKENLERKARILFLIIFSVFYYLWIDYYYLFLELIEEDSILEYLQFVLYCLSGVASLKIFLSLKNDKNERLYSLLFLLFSIMLFFISGEEISWGQRILGIKTPEKMMELNIQRETNIHNLFGYDVNQMAYILIGLYGIFSRKIITKFFPEKSKINIIFTPPKYLFGYFLFVFLAYFDRSFLNLNYDTVVDNVFRKYTISQWLEVAELYLAIAILIYLKSSFINLKTKTKY